MLKFGHSRHRALGDFKRTWRDDKTTCGVFWRSVKNHRTFRSVSMSNYVSRSQSLTGNAITEAEPLLSKKAEPFRIHSHTEYGNEKKSKTRKDSRQGGFYLQNTQFMVCFITNYTFLCTDFIPCLLRPSSLVLKTM